MLSKGKTAGREWMERDLILGISAVALLVAATVGVFQYEASQGGGSAFRVTFPVADAPGPRAGATSAVGQSASPTLAIGTPNATMVRFTLAWSDAAGDPDAFRVTITDPRGVARSAEGSGGTLTVAFEGLATPPPPRRVLAASADEAAARIAGPSTSTAAVGSWRAEVTLVKAPGTTVGGVEVQPDGENAWELTSVISSYAASVTQG